LSAVARSRRSLSGLQTADHHGRHTAKINGLNRLDPKARASLKLTEDQPLREPPDDAAEEQVEPEEGN